MGSSIKVNVLRWLVWSNLGTLSEIAMKATVLLAISLPIWRYEEQRIPPKVVGGGHRFISIHL